MKKRLILLSSIALLTALPITVYSQENVQEIITQREADFNNLEEVELFTGTWTVGTDVPEGRYQITGDGSGNLFVRDNEGYSVVNEILDNSLTYGVSSVTVDLIDGQEIEISGINTVWFTPYETEMRSSLGAGTWIVGVDIEPGAYIATTDNGSGNFFVRDEIDGRTSVNEILDSTAEWGVEKIALSLKEGQLIEISGLETVNFTER